MKRIAVLCLITIILVSFCACQKEADILVQSFSYAEDSKYYFDNELGVKKEGFVNVEEEQIKNNNDAMQRAKNEVTVEYDTTYVCYDKDEQIWRVDFFKEGWAGGGQSVYLNSKGITQIIVYSE